MIETDYLIVGAGASGMAFADALIAECDADVVMVDRRHCPGGHWNDAHPFVRIHHASACYGVNSRMLGTDSIDQTGPNAGFYERSTALDRWQTNAKQALKNAERLLAEASPPS